MRQELRMPALGQTSDELIILKWWKAVGDFVEQGELLLEVETDKATLEVESALEGTLLERLFEEGDVVETGTPIAIIGDETGEEDDKEVTETVDETLIPLSPQPAAPPPIRTHIPPAPRQPLPPPAPTTTTRVMIARPTARYMARLHGVSLAQIRGTGRDGLIEKRDVQAYIDKQYQQAARAAKAGHTSASRPHETRDMPVPTHRLKIAEQVTQSAQTIPQIQLSLSVNMEAALAYIEAQRENGLQQLKVTHLLLRAMSAALIQYPQVNTLWVDEGPMYRHLGTTHVGLAVVQNDHLRVVSIAEPASTSIKALVESTTAAINRAREGRLTASDLQPATITLSNLGMYGIDDFVALVEPGKTAILAAGRVIEVVTLQKGGIHLTTQMKLTLSVDHRVVDGALAALYLKAVGDYLGVGKAN